MPEAFAIETRELTRSFGSRVAVDHLNLQVPRGSIFGFLGPNGAGKTTTIRMLLGLLRPTTGEVRLQGEPFTRERRGILRGVGALPSDRSARIRAACASCSDSRSHGSRSRR